MNPPAHQITDEAGLGFKIKEPLGVNRRFFFFFGPAPPPEVARLGWGLLGVELGLELA